MASTRAAQTERKLRYLAAARNKLTPEQSEAVDHYLLGLLAERITLEDWEHTVDISTRTIKRLFPKPIGAST